MAQERNIVLAGTSDEEEALLRLLLRKAASHLKEPWTWGEVEAEADVILTDPLTIAGNVAIGNAKRHGIPYLVLSDTPRKGEEPWTLRRPPTVVDLARLLNGLELKEVPSLPVVSSQGDDFYNIDLESSGSASDVDESLATRNAFRPGHAHAGEDPDALFRRDPLARAVAVLKTHHLTADTALEPSHAPSTRGELRAVSYGNPFLKDFDRTPTGVIAGGSAKVEVQSSFVLDGLLSKAVVFGPCQHQLPGLPSLVLDPKLDVFHSQATLGELKPYCARNYSPADWKPVTTQALKALRETLPARSFLDLRFLCALLRSKGSLDARLDPGGTFWLQGVLKLDASLAQQRKILDAMDEARRLNEIVSASAASMGEVMDVINALNAIGLLGTRLRERLR
ncbi:MAG TPA: hypothetical protein PKZ76_10135 [Xanthomonadaceae bacterium]|nr:hypothetical protein [Xanthomonadaceae bacterium]